MVAINESSVPVRKPEKLRGLRGLRVENRRNRHYSPVPRSVLRQEPKSRLSAGAAHREFTDDDVQSSYGANEIIYCGYPDNNRASTEIGTGLNDPETQLYYVRNRTYSPNLGRWIQRDPIGYAGGINLYGYVGGNIISSADPRGMRTVTINVGIRAEFNELISAFEKLAKDLKDLEKPFHFLPGVHPYFNFIPWQWEKSPDLKGEADFEGRTLCSATVEAIGGGSVGARGGVGANTELVTGRIRLVLKLSFDFGITAKYSYKMGWSFGGAAGGTVSLDLAGSIEAWLVKATAYGGAQGYITGTVLSNTGDLVVKLGARGIAGVAVQYRTPFGSWEPLANVQAGFLNTNPYTVATVPLGRWIEQTVEAAG